MPETPANFQPSIHAADWLSPYLVAPAGATSLIDPTRRVVESLDGPWHFAIDPYDTCLRARWYQEEYTDADGRRLPIDFSFDDWETVPVPSCWNTLRGEWLWYEGSAVYLRNFAFTPGKTGERQFLHFEAASYAAYVFLNGTYLGWHRGGSTPFSFEVTGRLQASNRLLVVVNNDRRPERVPADNTDWFNYGGLHRSVGLVRVPHSFIKDAFVALRPDGKYSAVDVRIEIDGDAAAIATIEIPELGICEDFAVTDGVGSVVLEARPKLWAPSSPKLYDVTVRCAGDTWSDRIGFREIRVEGTDILINGRPTMLKGVCHHEESIERGRALTEDDIRLNLALARELGCTFVRLAHYPHSRLTARIADEVGMLLWEEIPVYWAIDFGNPDTATDAANQLAELVRRDRNRASVVIWSVGNENPDTDARLAFMSNLARLARRLDPTRLTSAACLVDPTGPVIADRLVDHVDLIGLNEYYGWYEPDITKLPLLFANSKPAKPVIITEFGAEAAPGLHGDADELFTEESQLRVYEQQLDVLRGIPYIKGISPWILYDFRCPRRAHVRQGYYNRKGLVDATRTRRKLAFEAMRRFYGELPDHPEPVA